MSTIQNIGLTEITTVELGNSTIGEDINSRFENIHNNFNVLSTTDYLKGDKGNSVKIIEFPIGLSVVEYPVVYEQNDLETPLTPEKLYNDLVLIITRESENETQTPISELNGLGENGYNKINLICEEVVENGIIKNILKGSLPFLYLDPNFSKGENLSTTEKNYSCLIIYDDNRFKKSTSIPKLYYDENIEDGENNTSSFCWEINGHKTGIIAQGPQGKNGRDGNCYIVKLGVQIEIANKNFDEGAGFYEIKQVFVSDENYIGWMDYEDFKENGNRLSIGSSCMCIFETDEYKLCFGVVAETGQDMERVIGVYTNLITNLVDFRSIELLDALSNISSNSEAGIRGLFVPYTTKANDVQRGHMIWANSVSDDLDTVPNEEDHSLHIGPIKNVLNNDLEIDNETTRANELNIHYGDIKLYSPLAKINPILLNLEASTENEMLFKTNILAVFLLQSDENSIYQSPYSYYFDIAYYGVDHYTNKQNLIISKNNPSSSSDQAYYRGRKIFNDVTFDMWQWDNSTGDHGSYNVYVLTKVITTNDEMKTNISSDNDIVLQSPSNLKLESSGSFMALNNGINISADNDIVLQSPSNLKLESPGSSVTLNDEINISTDNSIIINGSQGELKMNGDNVIIQGDSNVLITDVDGDSIQLNRGINISSDNDLNINSYNLVLSDKSLNIMDGIMKIEEYKNTSIYDSEEAETDKTSHKMTFNGKLNISSGANVYDTLNVDSDIYIKEGLFNVDGGIKITPKKLPSGKNNDADFTKLFTNEYWKENTDDIQYKVTKRYHDASDEWAVYANSNVMYDPEDNSVTLTDGNISSSEFLPAPNKSYGLSKPNAPIDTLLKYDQNPYKQWDNNSLDDKESLDLTSDVVLLEKHFDEGSEPHSCRLHFKSIIASIMKFDVKQLNHNGQHTNVKLTKSQLTCKLSFGTQIEGIDKSENLEIVIDDSAISNGQQMPAVNGYESSQEFKDGKACHLYAFVFTPNYDNLVITSEWLKSKGVWSEKWNPNVFNISKIIVQYEQTVTVYEDSGSDWGNRLDDRLYRIKLLGFAFSNKLERDLSDKIYHFKDGGMKSLNYTLQNSSSGIPTSLWLKQFRFLIQKCKQEDGGTTKWTFNIPPSITMSLKETSESPSIKFYIGKNGFIIGKTTEKYIQLEVDENKLAFYYRQNDDDPTDIIPQVSWTDLDQ